MSDPSSSLPLKAPEGGSDFRTIAWSVWLIVAICGMSQAYFSGSDHGLWGAVRERNWGFQTFGFWPGLLTDWQPNFYGQSITMFLTYGFIHLGPTHFLVNMATFVPLADAVSRATGNMRFLLIYAIVIVGGSLAYALWPEVSEPMVGASGGLFGLAGLLLAWDFAARRRAGRSTRSVRRILVLLVALNLALWWAMNGHLAWQTHLGGLITGWLLGYWQKPAQT